MMTKFSFVVSYVNENGSVTVRQMRASAKTSDEAAASLVSLCSSDGKQDVRVSPAI